MPVRAVIEIQRAADGTIPSRLIVSAFRASRTGPFVLALREIAPAEVDRVLDAVISAGELFGFRIEYVDAASERALRAAREARLVVAESDEFRASLTARGVAFESVAAAFEQIEALGRAEPLAERPVRSFGASSFFQPAPAN